MARSLRILVAHKKSTYQRLVCEQKDPTVRELLDENHASVRDLRSSDASHRRSVDKLRGHIDDLGLDCEVRYRGDVEQTDDYDLVVAVGGDGTVLDLSHRIHSTPILSINSDPDKSVGYFSAGTSSDFPRLVERIATEGWDPVELRRFSIRIDGRKMGPPVLNEILISHFNPAAVSRYFLKIGPHPPEDQKSSGVWVSTPAGSTAAIRSAGGLVLPFDSDNLQYLVREPFPPREGAYRFLKGIHSIDETLEVISRMRAGTVFVDGPHLTFDLPIGSTLSVESDAPSLRIFGLKEERRTA